MKLTKLPMEVRIQPEESRSFRIQGSMAIQHLSIKLDAADIEQALRSTVMEISFDGEKTVWAPVGDFFGIGYNPLYTNTWYTHCTADGQMNAFWVMPFEKNCTITFRNLGKQPVSIVNSFVGTTAWKWDTRSMHFGTTWQQYGHLFLGMETVDVNFATLEGKGVYIGDGIALFNSAYNWWGEGDEKIYIDGEQFPSHIGTGTEDYYGYAWCRPEIFTDHPFIAQPHGQGSFNPAYSVNTRYRALDKIPFNASLIVDMEIYKRRMNYAPVAHWYMMPGGKKLTDEDRVGAREKVARTRMDIYPAKLEFSIEGEDLDIPQRPQTGGINYPTHIKDLSGGTQLVWERVRTGNKGLFSFNCDIPGEYIFYGLFTKMLNGGIFNIYLNDRLVASNVDLYNIEVATVVDVEIGKVTLKPGNNTLVIELVSQTDGQTAESALGIDKLYFTK